MTTSPPDTSTLHQLALGFFHAHGSEHHGSQQVLFNRAAGHLEMAHGVPPDQAQLIAGHAYGAWRSAGEPRLLDIASSTATLAALTDPARGITYLVPVATLWRCLIDTPGRRLLHPVN